MSALLSGGALMMILRAVFRDQGDAQARVSAPGCPCTSRQAPVRAGLFLQVISAAEADGRKQKDDCGNELYPPLISSRVFPAGSGRNRMATRVIGIGPAATGSRGHGHGNGRKVAFQRQAPGRPRRFPPDSAVRTRWRDNGWARSPAQSPPTSVSPEKKPKKAKHPERRHRPARRAIVETGRS